MSVEPAFDDLFWAVHSGLPREGPGDDDSLRRGLALMEGLPPLPRILDIGCGPGAQSLALAEATAGSITAMDTHQPFLDALDEAARARGLADRITTRRASMVDPPFADGAFDVIWSEGAAYLMGFSQALTAWRRLLAPGGWMALTEACWLVAPEHAPGAARDLFAGYGAMTTVPGVLARCAEAGWPVAGHFVLPPRAWENYYGPMEARIADLRQRFANDRAALENLAGQQAEIDVYRADGMSYGYVMVVLRG